MSLPAEETGTLQPQIMHTNCGLDETSYSNTQAHFPQYGEYSQYSQYQYGQGFPNGQPSTTTPTPNLSYVSCYLVQVLNDYRNGGVLKISDIANLEVDEPGAAQEDIAWLKRPLVREQTVSLEGRSPSSVRRYLLLCIQRAYFLDRILRSWRMIPSSFATLNMAAIDAKKLKGWLFANIEHFSKLLEDIEDINYIYTTLVEKNHPDAVVEELFAPVGKSTSMALRRALTDNSLQRLAALSAQCGST